LPEESAAAGDRYSHFDAVIFLLRAINSKALSSGFALRRATMANDATKNCNVTGRRAQLHRAIVRPAHT
jgi:hypothetical protein